MPAAGLEKRGKQLEKRKTRLTFEEEAIIKNDTALISDEQDDILQVVSHVARTTVLKVRQKGDKVKGRMEGSEQVAIAVGGQWVLLDKMGKPIANEVGEVGRFERIDHSFQVATQQQNIAYHAYMSSQKDLSSLVEAAILPVN